MIAVADRRVQRSMSPLATHDLSVNSLHQLVGLTPLQVFPITAGGFPLPIGILLGFAIKYLAFPICRWGFPTPSRDNVGVATERLGFAARC